MRSIKSLKRDKLDLNKFSESKINDDFIRDLFRKIYYEKITGYFTLIKALKGNKSTWFKNELRGLRQKDIIKMIILRYLASNGAGR
jgi:hypothetical protein